MADERELKLKLTVDDKDLNSKLGSLGQNINKALGSGSGAQQGAVSLAKIDTALGTILKKTEQQYQAWQNLQKEIAKYEAVVKQLEGQKGMEQHLATAQSILAGLVAQQKKYIDDEEKIVEIIKQQNKLRQEANANRGGDPNNPSLTPHSQRQNSQLNNIAGMFANRLPGGGAFSAISQGAQGAGEEGGKFGMLAGGVGGLAALAGAEIIKKTIDAIGQLGDRAQEAAKHISDAGGAFDKLRTSQQKADYAKDKASNNPGVAAIGETVNNLQARFWGGVEKSINAAKDAWNGFGDLFKSDADKAKELAQRAQEKQVTKLDLTGDDKIQFDKMKRDRLEMEQDIARERDKMEHDLANKRRDYALEVQEFELQQERKKEDIAKERARTEEDYATNKQKLDEDQAFKTEQKKFELSRQFAQRDFALKQQDDAQAFQRQQSYKQQDLDIKQGDERQDFGISSSRAARNFNNRLADMAMSGASGLSYLQAARDYRNQREDAAQDLAIKQAREKRDLSKEKQRDTTEFGIKQGIEKRDFSNKQSDELQTHQLDVEQHYYELRYSQLELERQHSRTIQDLDIQMKRLAEDTALGRQKLGNEKKDMEYNEATTRRDFDIDTFRKRRGQSESEQQFAKSELDNLHAFTFGRTAMGTPELEDWLNKYQERAGQGGYINRAKDIAGKQKDIQAEIQRVQNDKSMSDNQKNHAMQALYQAMEDANSYDTGGAIKGDQLALVHDGEIVINPNHPDKNAQYSYLMQAAQDLRKSGGASLVPAFWGGGSIGDSIGGYSSASLGAAYSSYGGRMAASGGADFTKASDYYTPTAPVGDTRASSNTYNLSMPFSAQGFDNATTAMLQNIMQGVGNQGQAQLQAAMNKSNADKFRSLMLMGNYANVIR